MKRLLTIIISLFVLVATASAQIRYNNNPNLRYGDGAEVALRGIYTSEGFGGGAALTKIYHNDNVVGYGWGVHANVAYNKQVGSLVDVAVKPTIKFGRTAQLRISGLVGLGETHYSEFSQQIGGTAWNEYHNAVLAVKAGGEAALSLPLGKGVGLELFGGWQHSFADPEARELYPAEGWEISTDYRLNTWYAGLGLVFNTKYHQTSGDWCWHGGAYGGYSFAPTAKGAVVGIEAFNTKAIKGTPYWSRLAGFGVEQLFGEEIATNAVYGKYGAMYMPYGDRSVVFFETAAKVGVREYQKVDEGATSTGSFEAYRVCFALGFTASAEVGVGLHFGGWTIAALGEFGGHVVGKTKFESLGTAEYSGSTTSKLSGWDGQVKMRIAFAF